MKTCKDCTHFIGCGDWDLCCTESHDGYPFGFLCYEDTPACEKFDEKLHSLDLNKIQNRIQKTITTKEALNDVEPLLEEDKIWIIRTRRAADSE